MKRTFIFLVTSFLLSGFSSLSAQNYIMTIENLKKSDARTYEFDIFIKSTGENFVMDAYQAAFSINPEIAGGGNLSFQYVPGSSELNNVPSFGTGIYNYDNITELAFASYPTSTDLITGNKKRVGKFQFVNSKDFTANQPDIKWNFEGNVNTIIAASGYTDITNPENHKLIINDAPVFTSVLTADTISAGETLLFNYSAADVNNDQLSYSIYSITPAFAGELNINSDNGLLTFIPASADAGKIFSIIINVSDGKEIVSSSAALITVPNINSAPVFTSILNNQTITIGDTLAFVYSAVDADDDVINYSLHSVTPAVTGLLTINSSTGLFRFIPTVADTGKTFSVIVKVSDGKDYAFSEAANIKVNGLPEINNAPVFTLVLNNQTITVGDTLAFTYSAVDADDDVINYSLHSVTPAVTGLLSINSSTGLFRFIPTAADTGKTFSVVVKISDGKDITFSAPANIRVDGFQELNSAPMFTAVLSDKIITYGDTLSFHYSAIDIDNEMPGYSIYSVVPQPVGALSIDDSTGLFIFIPAEGDTGKTFTFIIEVSDWHEAVYSEPADITVSGIEVINNAPVFTSVLNNQTITIGDTLSFTYSAVDADDDVISYSLHSVTPAVTGLLTINSSTGLLRFIPATADTGKTFSVIIKISDGKDSLFSQAANIKVNGVQEINNAPVFTSILNNQTITIGDTLSFTYSAVDADDDAINYSLHSVTPAVTGLLTINSSTGLLRFIPATADTGKTFSVIIKISDGKDSLFSQAANIKVNGVQEINNAPVFTSVLNNQTITIGDTLSYTYSAVDADDDAINYSLHSVTPAVTGLLTINSSTGLLRFIPAAADTGKTFSVIIKISDGKDYAFSDAANIKVNGLPEMNTAPVFTSALDTACIFGGDTLIYNYSAFDEDGDSLKFFLNQIAPQPEGNILVDSISGKLIFISSLNDAGKDFTLTITINDSETSVVSDSAKIIVSRKNNPPVISSSIADTTIFTTDTLYFNYSAADADDDLLIYNLDIIENTLDGIVEMNPQNGMLTVMPSESDEGKSVRLCVFVTDGTDTSYSSPVKINIIKNNTTGIEENILPGEFTLNQNYPNPFNPATKINFSIPAGNSEHILLEVFDMLGSRTATLVDEIKTGGNYEITFDASNFASGIYIYRLSAKSFVQIKLMNLIK